MKVMNPAEFAEANEENASEAVVCVGVDGWPSEVASATYGGRGLADAVMLADVDEDELGVDGDDLDMDDLEDDDEEDLDEETDDDFDEEDDFD